MLPRDFRLVGLDHRKTVHQYKEQCFVKMDYLKDMKTIAFYDLEKCIIKLSNKSIIEGNYNLQSFYQPSTVTKT